MKHKAVKTATGTIREIKTNSSKWSNDLADLRSRFEWQKGYGTFTVSFSHIENVRNYIKNQHKHHKTKTFEEEFNEFLELHKIEFEHRYLFETEHLS
jgi:putative transposase